MQVHEEARDQVCILFNETLHLFLKQGLSFNLGLMIQLGWLANTTQGSDCLFPKTTALWLQMHIAMLSFLRGCWFSCLWV